MIRRLLNRAILLALGIVPATAGSFTSDFSNPNQTGFTLNGGNRPNGVDTYPTIADGVLTLTYNEPSETASIVLDDVDAGNSIEAFSLNFKLKIGPGSANAADGFAITFGPDVTSSTNAGEEGTGNFVVVVFDTYDNGGAEAPAIDVKFGGNVIAHTAFTKADMVTGNFEDVSLQVTRSGTLNLTWKGIKVYENLVLPDFAPSQGQLSLSARTGGESELHIIDDLTFTTTVAGPEAKPSISIPPQNITVAERGAGKFTVAFDGTAPLAFKWFKNGSEIPGETGPTLTLVRVPFADNGAKIKVEITNNSGTTSSAEAILGVTPDAVAPTIDNVLGSEDFTHVTVTFSEPVSRASAEKASNYSIPGLAVSSATRLDEPNDHKVVLVTSAQTAGTEYTLTVTGVTDTATGANAVADGTSARFNAFALVVGGLKFEAWVDQGGDMQGTAVQTLLDNPRFPGSPDIVGYVTQFSSRQIFTDASHENYGGRISGWIVPPANGDYEFFIRSDDASQLFLSTDDKRANAVLIAQENGCCGPFEEPGAGDNGDGTFPTSAAVSLVANKAYYIEALWKEGGGGDYCDVAWRKVGDATSPRSLPYIPGSVLEAYAQPTTFVSPTVAFTAPADGATYDTNVVVTLTASATSAAAKRITKVEFLELGKVVGTATSAPYSVNLTGLSEGPHKFVARATDDAGISADTGELVVNIGKETFEFVISKIDAETEWKYDRSGTDLGTAWREKDYNDAAWPSGKMLIADETTTTVEPIRTPINRFNDNNEYVKTFYFRRKFNFNFQVNSLVNLQLRHAVDDGVIFYLNGKEIHRLGIAADPVDFLSDASGHENAWEGPYTIPSSYLVEGENILAAEVHQSGGSSSDMVFGAEMIAYIPLVLKQIDVVKIDDTTTWSYDRSGTDLGTAWREKGFVDTSWPNGKALIADETTTTVEPIRTPISRFNDNNEYVKTFYFRTHFNLPIPSTAGAKLKLRHVVDDGAVFYLNGKEIHRFGITADPFDFLSDAAGHENAWEGPYDIPITDLVVGENVLAAEVHQSGGSSSDMVFGAELVAIVKAQQVPGVSDAPKLYSSDAVAEGYAEAAGVTVDEANKKFTIPSPGSNKFFRINGPTAVTITSIKIVGNTIEISYQ